jgi:hypothetical protein
MEGDDGVESGPVLSLSEEFGKYLNCLHEFQFSTNHLSWRKKSMGTFPCALQQS